MDRLKDKTVLVTGAAQGIGAALARGLVARYAVPAMEQSGGSVMH